MDRSDLHEYQNKALAFIKDKRKCALFLDMGLGKTVSTLTAISDMLDDFSINKILIIAPLRVANTVWKQEAQKWDHLKHLNFSLVTGSGKERAKAIEAEADIYIINRENVKWLTEGHEGLGRATIKWKWKWDMVVVDESSSFKSHKSQRFKALRKMTKHFKSVVLLTGTPSPNGIADLWSQMYLLDNGERLGRTLGNFRSRFLVQEGYMSYAYRPRKGSSEEIQGLIKDVCITMSAEDYLELPEKISLRECIELPDNVQAQYDELEKEFLLTLESGDVEALSAAVLGNKLLQVCNGAVYDTEGVAHTIHDLKLKALKEIIEDHPNENFLIAYNFRSDLVRLSKMFPQGVTLSKSTEEIDRWNKGEIKLLFAHPASAGHGLNLQAGGSNIVWFGLNWSLELYQQFNARLHRQGQNKPVKIIHIVVKKGIDEKVMKALGSKAKTQKDLLEYLKK
jgi:SNF2 family DNA or RNA helicase